MTTEKRFLRTTMLATTVVLASGIAASSVALNNGAEISPGAAAQTVQSDSTKGQDDNAVSRDGDGAATEFVGGDNEYIGGDTEAMTEPFTHTAAYRDYEDAMTRGQLEAAAEALTKATERPITESFVLDVNRNLGVESTLPAEQVAEVASDKQRMN